MSKKIETIKFEKTLDAVRQLIRAPDVSKDTKRHQLTLIKDEVNTQLENVKED